MWNYNGEGKEGKPGKLLQEDPFGSGRGTEAGGDGVAGKLSRACEFWSCKLKTECDLMRDEPFSKAKSDL